MDFSAMYLVGGIFNLLFLIASIVGYFYMAGKLGKKFSFWLFFAVAWFFSMLSYIFLILGAPSSAWHITLLRVLTYIFHAGTIASLFVELVKFKK